MLQADNSLSVVSPPESSPSLENCLSTVSRAKAAAERKLPHGTVLPHLISLSPLLLPILPSPPVPPLFSGEFAFVLFVQAKNNRESESPAKSQPIAEQTSQLSVAWATSSAPQTGMCRGRHGGRRGKRERCPHLLYHGSPPESGTALKSGHLLRQLLAVHSRGFAKGQ